MTTCIGATKASVQEDAMRNFGRTIAIALAALVLVWGTVSTAQANHFDKSDLKCRKGIAKGFLKAVTTADKTSGKCHKDRQKGKLGAGVDCNDLGPEPGTLGAADGKGKFAKAQQKLIDTPAKKCADLASDNVLSNFVSCPADCEAALGLPNPLTSLDQAVQCLACVAGDYIGAANDVRLDSPDPLSMSKDDMKCAQTVAKAYSKYLASILKSRTKCQDGADKDGGDDLNSTCQSSNDPDGKGKIAKALNKAEGLIDKKCPTANLTNVSSCATTNLTDLKACLETATNDAEVALFPSHYELTGTICPIGVRSKILAGVGVNGTSDTFLDVGWTGFGHGVDIPDDYDLESAVTCPNGAPPCGTCTVDGIRQTGVNYTRFLRCSNDFSNSCDEPFANDVDDCGGSFCTYVLGPPLPISAGNNPTCSINALANDLSGTVIVETGDAELQLNLSTRVYLPGVLVQPCPVCVGDPVANDGVAGGVCAGNSTRDGLACDTQGYDGTFAAQANGEGLSLDCVPPAGTNISGTGLKISLPLTTGSSSLGFDTPCDSPLGFLDCACAQCSGDLTVACRNDTECSDIGAGTCNAKSANSTNRQPNDCGSFANCVDVGGEKGECSDKSETYCTGLVRANGEGFLACANDGECVNASFPCPGNDCGPCGMSTPRPCYLDPIEATGTPDPDHPTLVSTFCLPPTTSLSINSSTGTTGPGRVAISQDTTLLFN
jgi:hypothetical protein